MKAMWNVYFVTDDYSQLALWEKELQKLGVDYKVDITYSKNENDHTDFDFFEESMHHILDKLEDKDFRYVVRISKKEFVKCKYIFQSVKG